MCFKTLILAVFFERSIVCTEKEKKQKVSPELISENNTCLFYVFPSKVKQSLCHKFGLLDLRRALKHTFFDN